MKKSIPAFVLGLIFSIIGAISAYLFYAVFILVGALTQAMQTAIIVLPILNLICFAISFVGSILCLFHKKVGGIILLLASIISLTCYIVIIIKLKLSSLRFLFFTIPTIIILIVSLTTFKTKKSPNN